MKKNKNKIRWIIISIIGVIIVGLIALSMRQAVPNNYFNKVETGGILEAKYLAKGTYEVDVLEKRVLENFKKYEIYYPNEISHSDKVWPVIIVSNGTGVKASSYKAWFEHLASWGFVVVGTEEEYSWNGFSSEMCLRLMMNVNENEEIEGWEENPFYQHLDLENIGAVGHSQGGAGVINAITDTQHADMYKAAFSASPSNKELSHALEWDYDASKIDIPICFMSSTGEADEGLVVSGEQLRDIYDDVTADITKVIARRNDANHGDMLYYADGYMTAWFCWILQGDMDAAKCFVGDNPELMNNSLYQNIEIQDNSHLY